MRCGGHRSGLAGLPLVGLVHGHCSARARRPARDASSAILPPGPLLGVLFSQEGEASHDAVQHTEDYVTSVVVGHDIIPRLSIRTMALRTMRSIS